MKKIILLSAVASSVIWACSNHHDPSCGYYDLDGRIKSQTLTDGKLITVERKYQTSGTHRTVTDLTGLETNQGNQNALGVKHNAAWADQIQNGEVVNDSTLKINERSKSRTSTKSTYIDLSGLKTNQGTQNAANIGDIYNTIDYYSQQIEQMSDPDAQPDAVRYIAPAVDNGDGTQTYAVTQDDGTGATGITTITKSAFDATNNTVAQNRNDILQNVSNISTLDNRVTTNENSISTNAQNIQTNLQGITANSNAITTLGADVATNNANIHQNANDISDNAQKIADNNTFIGINTNNIRQNRTDINKNSSWADQIQSGTLTGRATLTMTEQSRDGSSTKNTDIDLSGLVTDKARGNTQMIRYNRQVIRQNTSAIDAHIQADKDLDSTNELITGLTSNANGVTITEGTGASAQSRTVDLRSLKTNLGVSNESRITTNETNINTNSQHISTNTSNIALNRTDIDKNTKVNKKQSRKINKNSKWADQLSDVAVNGSNVTFTETSRVGGHTSTVTRDFGGLVTNQGTQNRAIIDSNTNRIQTNETNIATNRTDINTNTNTIAHNAGGIVDGNNIKSNKDLTTENKVQQTQINTNSAGVAYNSAWNASQDVAINNNAAGIACNSQRISVNSARIEENWQSIQINAGNIEYLADWNTEQQNQIDDLYGITGGLQYQINGLSEYTVDSAAGSAALSSIDFGTVEAGHWEFGVGIGYGGGFQEVDGSFSGAIGAKYGYDETTAFIGKGWVSENGNAAGALGVVWKY